VRRAPNEALCRHRVNPGNHRRRQGEEPSLADNSMLIFVDFFINNLFMKDTATLILFIASGKILYDAFILFGPLAKQRMLRSFMDKDPTSTLTYLSSFSLATDHPNIEKAVFPVPYRRYLCCAISTVAFVAISIPIIILVNRGTTTAFVVCSVYVLCAIVGSLFPCKAQTSMGIVDFCWYGFTGIVVAILLYCQFQPCFLSSNIAPGLSQTYYTIYHDETQSIAQKTVECVLIVGTVLAVCMSILWNKDIWNSRKLAGRLEYIETSCTAMKMILSYCFVGVATLVWVTGPLLEKSTALREILRTIP